uniref:Matrin-type domain-containing protein n=1 Tax=Oryzias melastigma TaxID=30732 RepID=A0A3B3CX94_ORYME
MQEQKTSSVKGEEEDPEKERSISTRSTRGRRATNQDEVKKDDLSSRRSTPTRQSLRQKEKLPKTEDEAPPKESTSTEKSADVIKDTSEEDPASEDQPPVQAKPRRGRPKKNTKKGKKQVAAPKKAESPVKEVEEDEDEFQIIDSVEGEAADAPASMDQTESTGASSSKDEETKSETTTGLLLNEEEEPLYQILDSVEDDAPQEEPTPMELSNVKVEEDAKEKSPIETEDDTASEDQKKVQLPSADGGDGSSTEDTTLKTEEEPLRSSQSADLIGPESKRARSESPTVSNKFLLPPYNPKSPIGQEHVVPKSGFFCNICSIFYLTEKAAKEVHCSSQRHYENLQVGQNAKYSTTKDEYLMFMHFFPHQNHYKKLQWKSSRTQSSHGSLSD